MGVEAGLDERAIARWRMHTLRLTGQTYPSPARVVAGLLAVQAENAAQSSWAVATRASGALTEPDIGRLLDDGVILRTHVLRPTWHYVRADDIRWLVELTAPRVRRLLTQVQRSAGVDDAELDRGAQAIVDVLSGGVHLTREALGERLADAGVRIDGGRLRMLVFHAELSALVCSGVRDGAKQTYALLDERAPDARRLDRDEALVELVVRYFTGHGPATERDLAYWATMTLTDVRAGLAEAGDRLDAVDHGGRTYWFGQPRPDDGAFVPRAHLLQTLDEYHNGYQDSRHVLDVDRLVPPGRAAAVGMALVDGQMVGHVRRTVRAHDVVFDVGLFRDLDTDEHAALHAAAERYGRFLEREATVIAAPART